MSACEKDNAPNIKVIGSVVQYPSWMNKIIDQLIQKGKRGGSKRNYLSRKKRINTRRKKRINTRRKKRPNTRRKKRINTRRRNRK
jgi:hypothetical protein